MEVLPLRVNMCLQHTPDQAEFSRWLLDIGHGRTVDDAGNTEIPQNMITYSEDQLIDSIYGDICNSQGPPPPEYFLHHAILAP